MRTSNYYSNRRTMVRCHVPLISICDNTSQIKLHLGACGICAGTPAALWLRKGGCTEWETVCTTPRQSPCCGVVDNRPVYWGSKSVVEKPKPSIIYPLHEIDTQGMSVFVLDDKLKELGYGRYRATVMLAVNKSKVSQGTSVDVDYEATNLVFDVDYIKPTLSMTAIDTETLLPSLPNC